MPVTTVVLMAPPPSQRRLLPAAVDFVASNPARLLTTTFIGLCVAGAALLRLPVASSTGDAIEWVDAAFTATSAVCVTGLIVVAASKGTMELAITRTKGLPFEQMATGQISNGLSLHVRNRTQESRTYTAEVLGVEGAEIISAKFPLTVGPNDEKPAESFVLVPPGVFVNGAKIVTLRVIDDLGNSTERTFRLAGPKNSRTPNEKADR